MHLLNAEARVVSYIYKETYQLGWSEEPSIDNCFS
jgi:hypothetical protein